MHKNVRKCAAITGIYGQDGSLLAARLLAAQYHVVGLVERCRPSIPGLEAAQIVEVDIADSASMRDVFRDIQPDECYHLAAAHHSSETIADTDMRALMLRTNFLSTQALLDAMLEFAPACRFLYAGSSQMYTADTDVTVVDENRPYRPSTYYGITKVASAQLIDLLRRERGLWGLTAILFNHESTQRGVQYISRKVTRAAAQFRASNTVPRLDEKLRILDATARTDWSAATDIVRAMQLALQAETPADYVFASGHVHAVSDMLAAAFGAVGLDWRDYVASAPAPQMPKPCLVGNPHRACESLNWMPKTSFGNLMREMVLHDLSEVQAVNSAGKTER